MLERTECLSSNHDRQYSFEVAELYLPEERKAYCVLRLEEVKGLKEQLELLLSEDSSDTLKSASLFPKFGELMQELKFPVRSELLEIVNSEADADGRKILDWDGVRQMYGVINQQELRDAVTGFEDNPSKETVKTLIVTLEETHRGVNDMLNGLGGDSDERLKKIVELYDPDIDSGWHPKRFGEIEKEIIVDVLNTVRKRFELSISEIVVDDMGCGTGRSVMQLVEIFQTGFGDKFDAKSTEELLAFLSKLHAIDISRNKVLKTIDKIKKIFSDAGQTYDGKNVEEGDFNAYEPHGSSRINENSVHVRESMMRTIQYNITKAKIVTTLRKAARELVAGTEERAGGMYMCDTTKADRVSNATEKENATLEDLKHFYPQLMSKYVRDNQKHMPDDVDLDRMPRYPIYDNTTGHGFYWREVFTVDYFEHLIKQERLDLTVRLERYSQSPLKEAMLKDPGERKEATTLGRKWLKDNELEEYYRSEITRRLDAGIIEQELLDSIGYNGDCEVILDYLALNMVSGFTSEYIILERPVKKPRTQANAA